MSEEQNEGADEGIDMDTILEFEDGTEATLGEILQAQQEAAEAAEQAESRIQGLERFRENATRLMRGDSADEQAAFEVLKGAGFSDAEARQYASEYVQDEAGGEETDMEGDVDEVQIEKMLKRTTAKAEGQAEAAMREARDMRLRLLKQEMDRRVVESIDKNPQIVKMLETLDKTRGRDHAAGAWRALQEQVREATLKNLYGRRDATGGQFSEEWVAEEAAKAADAIAGNYRTVIGDIDALGRSPETDGELETLRSQKPVAPPEYKKGMDRGAADASVRDFNVDALTRLAADMGAGGETKV
jgi:hypothetical protein